MTRARPGWLAGGPSSLRMHARRAGALMTSGTGIVLGTVAVTNLLRIASSMTLTRLLDAEAFGVTGIISSISFVLAMVSDIGTIPFVIRHETGDDRAFLDEVWTARLVRGVAITIAMGALSGVIARYAGKPALQPVIAAWSVTFLLEGLSSMVFATALRERKVGWLSILDVATGAFQIVASIVATLILHSYWGIVAGVIAGAALRTLLSYTLFPGSVRRLRFSAARSLELWRFSRFIVSSSILGIFISQTDKIFFARILSLEMFGLYAIATSLANTPMAIVSAYTERILYPAYAAAFRTAPETLRAVYYDRKRLVSLLYMFAVGGLSGAAPLVVAILYDPRYQSVALLLSILAIGPLLAFNNWAADRVLIANGQSWNTVTSNFARLGWLLGGSLLALATGRQMVLVVTVGTIEAPATVLHWIVQSRYRLLDLRQELAGLLAAGAGVAAGAGGAAAILSAVRL